MNDSLTTLDVGTLPVEFDYWHNKHQSKIGLQNIVFKLEPVIESMMANGVIERHESFGFAMANPTTPLEYTRHWDHPEKLIGFVSYWGPDGKRYAANAVRKIRAAARTSLDTQTIRLECPDKFRDEVESVESDGTFAWGDFPYDGAVHVNTLGRHLLGAVSAYPKEQDPIVASLILHILGHDMFEADKMP